MKIQPIIQSFFILILFFICNQAPLFPSLKRKNNSTDTKTTKKRKNARQESNDAIENILNLEVFPKIDEGKYLSKISEIKGDFGSIEFPLKNKQIKKSLNLFKSLGHGNFLHMGPLILYPVLPYSIQYGERVIKNSLNNPNWIMVFSTNDQNTYNLEGLTNLLWYCKTIPVENTNIFLTERIQEFLNSLKIHHLNMYEKIIKNISELLLKRKIPISGIESENTSSDMVVSIVNNNNNDPLSFDNSIYTKKDKPSYYDKLSESEKTKIDLEGFTPETRKALTSIFRRALDEFNNNPEYYKYIPDAYKAKFYKEDKKN